MLAVPTGVVGFTDDVSLGTSVLGKCMRHCSGTLGAESVLSVVGVVERGVGLSDVAELGASVLVGVPTRHCGCSMDVWSMSSVLPVPSRHCGITGVVGTLGTSVLLAAGTRHLGSTADGRSLLSVLALLSRHWRCTEDVVLGASVLGILRRHCG